MKLNLLLLLSVLPCLSACNVLHLKRHTVTTQDWSIWPGYNNSHGAYDFKTDGLYYYLQANQDDTRDLPEDGYFPGLILSRDLPGFEWTLDMEANFDLPNDGTSRFSCGVWIGDNYARPSLGNFSSVLIQLFRIQSDSGSKTTRLMLISIPNGIPHYLEPETKIIRFERKGSLFNMYTSANRKNFNLQDSVSIPGSNTAPRQVFFLSGHSGGKPVKSYIKLKSLQLNRSELLTKRRK